jgi:iron complex outermembrane receptor protein
LACGTCGSAFAQTKPAPEAAVPDDIIVNARRVDERLQDVPISITVFNQQQLASRNVVNAQDLATYTPSLSANANFGNENTTFALRGFAQDIGTAPSVGVYFADVVAPRGASNGLPAGDGALPGSFFDLQSVQVLKGPQGTLFGRNTTGGAVLLVPQKPTYKLEGYAEGSYGNYDMRRVQGVLNIPLSDTFRVRMGVDRMTRDGYLINTSGIGPKDFNNVNYWAGRLSIVADLTPNLENYIVASYTHSNTAGPINKLVAANAGQGLGFLAIGQFLTQSPGFYDVVNPLANSYSRITQWQVIDTTTWHASDTLTIKNIASYAQYTQNVHAPEFGTNFPLNFGQVNPQLAFLGTYYIPFTQISPPPGLNTADQSTFTEELQFQGSAMDNRLTWQAGGYLEISDPLGLSGSQSPFLAACRGDGSDFQCTDPVGFLTNLNPLIPAAAKPIHVGSINYTVGTTTFHDVGLYAQATYKLAEKLKLTGGFRYTWDKEVNVSDRRTYIPQYPPQYGLFPAAVNPLCTDPTAIATKCVTTLNQKSSKPTWLIDLDYTPTQDILLYGKYARGYRSATIAPNVSAPLNLVAPEQVDSYEIGVKTGFHGAVHGTFNVAAFYNNFTNQQLQVGFNAKIGSGQASTAAPINAGKSTIYGLEAAATLTPFRGLDLTADYTYLHTEIKAVRDLSSYNDPNFDLAAPFQVGDPEVLSPKNKFSISATYTLPLDESVGRISFGAIFTHRDGMLTNYIDRSNPDATIAAFSTLPALDLLNLNASWNSIAGSPVDLSVFATNVTNKKYYTYAAGLGSPQVGFETAAVGEPQMYGARIRVRFGK